jgi:hypothetical protein
MTIGDFENSGWDRPQTASAATSFSMLCCRSLVCPFTSPKTRAKSIRNPGDGHDGFSFCAYGITEYGFDASCRCE